MISLLGIRSIATPYLYVHRTVRESMPDETDVRLVHFEEAVDAPNLRCLQVGGSNFPRLLEHYLTVRCVGRPALGF